MPRYRIPFLAGAGVETDDGRIFEAVTWRNLPLPFAFQWDTQHSNTATSEVVGQIIELEQGTDGAVAAIVDVDPRDENNRPIHPAGARAAATIEQGGAGVSIDGLLPTDATIEEECLQEDEDGWCLMFRVRFSEVVIGGATGTPIPAYARALIDPTPLGADNQPLEQADAGLELGLVASAATAAVPALVVSAGFALTAGAAVDLAGWALDPGHFVEPADLDVAANSVNVDDDGRIWGWIAYAGVCHSSFPDACVRADDQSQDLGRFLRNAIPVGEQRLRVGFLTMDTGHASTGRGTDVTAHYDDTRNIAAIVTAGIRDEGIWFSGSVSPLLNAWQQTVLAAAQVSGDWRADFGETERTLRAALVVPVPGFGRPALAASGVHDHADGTACGCGGTGAPGGAPVLSAAQTAALGRLADRQLAGELVDLDAKLALTELPARL